MNKTLILGVMMLCWAHAPEEAEVLTYQPRIMGLLRAMTCQSELPRQEMRSEIAKSEEKMLKQIEENRIRQDFMIQEFMESVCELSSRRFSLSLGAALHPNVRRDDLSAIIKRHATKSYEFEQRLKLLEQKQVEMFQSIRQEVSVMLKEGSERLIVEQYSQRQALEDLLKEMRLQQNELRKEIVRLEALITATREQAARDNEELHLLAQKIMRALSKNIDITDSNQLMIKALFERSCLSVGLLKDTDELPTLDRSI